ncbi:MAG: UDP-glucose/GDP-mannose dehydrogenase family protein [Chloroflexi bacterium]|nr:UDP-glucose/GDP-mannose dehydrogenase family protein [Chloroflexota bacterium]
MAQVVIIGAGYVGLTTGACLASLGNRVLCLDIDEDRIETLRRGGMPIFEPGLKELIQSEFAQGRIQFTTSYAEAIPAADFIFIAVNTPQSVNGQANMAQVEAAVRELANYIRPGAIIVNKSTMPVGSMDRVIEIISRSTPRPFAVVANPEFLREGSAVHDSMHPDRIVLGSSDEGARQRVADLFAPLQAPLLLTDPRTAEMIKYASNAFLATKISFINEIAQICDRLGADVAQVARGMGLDPRIGPAYLNAGIGWGGSCFPKDMRALEYLASTNGAHPQLLRAVIEINRDQRIHVVRLARELVDGLRGARVGLLGLSFKPNTDDMRDAPSLEIVSLLESEGALVRAYDPAASERARRLLPGVEICASAAELASGADAIIVVTEWDEFRSLDLAKLGRSMRKRVLIDGRNIYDSQVAREAGFIYRAIGRAEPAPSRVAVA